ncbi:MAG: lysoplasmalogenase [Bacteroidota bacterium]|nr:lysoplasmalogenase [Bacteroidota bacterium]
MQLLKKKGILVFWLILLLDCYFTFQGQTAYRNFTKVLLVPVIILYIFLNARKNVYRNTKTLVFFALVAAWVGDILLLNSGTIFFLLGMLAFATMHILFIITFYRFQKIRLSKGQEAFIAAVIMGIVAFQVFRHIKPELGALEVPVIIYMAIISITMIVASNLLSSNARKFTARTYFVPGAALFVVSDTILALQMFLLKDVEFLSVIVMLSYGYALSLFGEGFAKTLKG